MSTTTICIIDDHKIVRQGLKELLEKIGNFKVIQEFESGTLFLEGLPLQQPADIYILDYSMPKINGIEVLQELEKRKEEYKVLLLTQQLEEQIIDLAYHHGARGFLHKNCTAHDLKFAIDAIVKIGYNNITEILKRIRMYDSTLNELPKTTILLSDREIKFLELVCDEKEFIYEQMAEIMSVSVKSIDVYRSAIFERYNIKSKVGLVLFSFKHKLTKPFL